MKRFLVVFLTVVALVAAIWSCDNKVSSKPVPNAQPMREYALQTLATKAESPAPNRSAADLSGAKGPASSPAPAEGSTAGPSPMPAMPTVNVDRYLIKNATATVEVVDSRAASAQLLPTIQTTGGYVGGYNEVVDGFGRRSIVMQIRVPATKFDETLGLLDTLGKVLNKQVTTQDVTEDYVDTDARSRNLKATEARLLDHLTHTGKVEDTLRIEQEITRVREEIERLDGHMRFLTDRVQFSTVALTLQEAPKSEPVVPVETFSTAKTFTEAVRSLVEFGQYVWERVIWYGVWAVVWVPCGLLGWFVFKRVRKVLSK